MAYIERTASGFVLWQGTASLTYSDWECISCEQCEPECPDEAIYFRRGGIDVGNGVIWSPEGQFGVRESSCIVCGLCTEVCPTNALFYDDGTSNPNPGGSNGGNTGNPPAGDPDCAAAKPASDKSTALSANPKFNEAKEAIKEAAKDGKEHAISFGKNTSGQVILSNIVNGSGTTVGGTGSVSGKFAHMHNHPENYPPSSGDLYSLIGTVKANAAFESAYIITPNGTVYSLVVTDSIAAAKFFNDYPKVESSTPGEEPAFPEALANEYFEIIEQQKGWYDKTPQEANEIAFTYMLNKYKTGVSLLKQKEDGSFSKKNTTKDSNATGNPFSSKDC